MSEAPLSKEEQEWNEWKQHPCTQALFAWVARQRNQLRSDWEAGAFTDFNSNVEALGACRGLRIVSDVEFEQVNDKGDQE